jgi:hypothetical protein
MNSVNEHVHKFWPAALLAHSGGVAIHAKGLLVSSMMQRLHPDESPGGIPLGFAVLKKKASYSETEHAHEPCP